jgi:hypothetical protein
MERERERKQERHQNLVGDISECIANHGKGYVGSAISARQCS